MTDARHCVQLHPNLCTPEWDLPGMGSDCKFATMNGLVYQPRDELSDHLAVLGGYQLIHVWYQKKFYKSPQQIMFVVLQRDVSQRDVYF